MPAEPNLRAYLNDPDLRGGDLAGVLRPAFASAFAAQALVALLLVVVFEVFAGRSSGSSPWFAPVASGGAALLVAAGLAVAAQGVRAVAARADRLGATRGRGALRDDDGAEDVASDLRDLRTSALRTALLAGSLLSGSLWFAALAWLGGDRGAGLLGAFGLASLGFLLGSLQVGALARAARIPRPTPPGGRVRGTTEPEENGA